MILGDKKAIVDWVICGVIDHFTVEDKVVAHA